jgi:hypothetical protein
MKATSVYRASSWAVAAMLVAASSAWPQTPVALHVRLGLWETTTTTEMSGMPDMGNLPPEQQARAEAMMKGMMQHQTPHTVRSCLTKEKLDRTLFGQEDKNCKQTVETNTSSVYAFKIECTGEHPTPGEWRFEALSPEGVKGAGSMKVDRGMTVKSSMTAKWLGESCGNVK